MTTMHRSAAVRRGSRRERDDSGLSIIEVVLALALFALIMVGVAASAGSGLRLAGRSDNRQQATQVAVQLMESIRTQGFTAVGLKPTTTWDMAAGSPDVGAVDTTTSPPTYDIPLANGAADEVLVMDGTLDHKEPPVTLGSRTVQTYTYVTWADATRSEKRVTIVAVYEAEEPTGESQVVMSSIFSRGAIDSPATELVNPAIPAHSPGATFTFQVASADEFPAAPTFKILIDGELFTVTAVSGSTWTAEASGSAAHSAGADIVFVPAGSPSGTTTTTTPTSSTTTTSTTTTTLATGACPSDTQPPSVSSFTILKGAAAGTSDGFTNSNNVTISSSASDAGSGNCTPLQMEFSNSPTFAGSWRAYATSATWDTTPGDGSKSVYARFRDAQGNVAAAGGPATVTVDTIAPTTPSNFTAVRVGDRDATLTWTHSSTDTNFVGYLVYRRAGTGPFEQETDGTFSASCSTAGATCTWTAKNNSLNRNTGYTFYVVAVDKAGNLSAKTPEISI